MGLWLQSALRGFGWLFVFFNLNRDIVMGLDISIKKMARSKYDNIPQKELWHKEFDVSEEVFYYRKEYEILGWFQENTSIYEECSSEITKEQLDRFCE